MGRAPALCSMHQTSGSPHLTLTLTTRKAERQRINQEPWDQPTSAFLVVVHGVTGLTLWMDRPSCDFYPVKEKRTSEEAARGGRRRTCHPWRGLGDSRSRNRPDGWHVADWLARQAKFFAGSWAGAQRAGWQFGEAVAARIAGMGPRHAVPAFRARC
jgi:hypothetical protein